MVLDIYEGERPHIKFCRYLGEVTVFDLPKGKAGSVRCEFYLEMNDEGLMQVKARDLNNDKTLRTQLNTNPEHLNLEENKDDTELDPIEAERYKKQDYDLVYELESLDEFLEEIYETFDSHEFAELILDRIFETKEYIYKRRKIMSIEDCQKIKNLIQNFIQNLN